ncbi:MAG: bifunctional phosphoribosylaminoimidazolecarboxamide formyltransferase/IMP cyclohydrolase [Deltaproteobacteria bacterium]|nr:bifunctional phosphoribosylaminoimidazolecarboxamide formyltransferase/IMP cyclohydrolase [Deltaproteobacteria bacterium]
MIKPKRALLSTFDKRGLKDLASTLSKLGIEIISTKGTGDFLHKNGIDTIPVEELTGFSEMFDGRVKTLHPNIFGAILGPRDSREEFERFSLKPIDMVVVNLYPFEEMMGESEDKIIENIDIGGVALLRAGAKNFKHVVVLTDIEDYRVVEEELMRNEGFVSYSLRRHLAGKAFSLTSYYDAIIGSYFTDDMRRDLALPLKFIGPLRYGENPHQQAILYKKPKAKLFDALGGKKLSFNNVSDIDAAFRLLKEFKEPFSAIIKHGNPCGAACGKDVKEAFLRAKQSDNISYFGGIVGFNRDVDETLAEEIIKDFFEVVIAPSFTPEALDVLSKKKNLRIIKISMDTDVDKWDIRSVCGGYLVQQTDDREIDLEVVTDIPLSEEDKEELLFAWKIVKHVKSNAIVITNSKQVLAIGGGETSRIDALRVAEAKASVRKHELKGAVMASDGFFPFADSIELASKIGIRAIIQPGGSVRDKEVIDKANECKIPMVFTHVRCFRH